MNPARCAIVLAAVCALAACGPAPSGGDPTFQARQLAGMHQAAQDAADRPGVACALGGLDNSGLPTAPLGALVLQLDRDGQSAPEQEKALLEELAQDLWDSDLAITQLNLLYTPGGPSLGDALGTRNSFVSSPELEAAFGPKPPRPDPLPPFTDPGNPDC